MIELPVKTDNASTTFNVGDLAPYINDEDLNTKVTPQVDENYAGATNAICLSSDAHFSRSLAINRV